MQVTIHDVAKAANVSIGTVSRALNGSSLVSPESAKRVKEAVKTMNYRPLRSRKPAVQRQLVGKRIALVVLGMDRTLESLPVVASALHGVQTAIAQAGATLLLVDVPELYQLPPALAHEEIDGFVLKGAQQGDLVKAMSPELREQLWALPGVWFLGQPKGAWGDAVSSNDLLAGSMAAEHLVARGHTRLAFLNPKTDHQVFRVREISFRAAAEIAGASVKSFVMPVGEAINYPLKPVERIQSVQELVDAMLAESPRPTAVFTPADSIAVLIYRALAERGLVVGRDISLISCNCERPLIAGLLPALTTIDVHAETIGRLAVDQLAVRLTNAATGPAVEIHVAPTLVEGESVARI